MTTGGHETWNWSSAVTVASAGRSPTPPMPGASAPRPRPTRDAPARSGELCRRGRGGRGFQRGGGRRQPGRGGRRRRAPGGHRHDRLGTPTRTRRAVLHAGGIAAVRAPNLSLGAAIFGRIVERAATDLATLPDFEPYLREWHRRGKADRPSGTATDLARRLIAADPRQVDLDIASHPRRGIAGCPCRRLRCAGGDHRIATHRSGPVGLRGRRAGRHRLAHGRATPPRHAPLRARRRRPAAARRPCRGRLTPLTTLITEGGTDR